MWNNLFIKTAFVVICVIGASSSLFAKGSSVASNITLSVYGIHNQRFVQDMDDTKFLSESQKKTSFMFGGGLTYKNASIQIFKYYTSYKVSTMYNLYDYYGNLLTPYIGLSYISDTNRKFIGQKEEIKGIDPSVGLFANLGNAITVGLNYSLRYNIFTYKLGLNIPLRWFVK